MRVPIIAGNWKMHKTVAESVDFVKKIKDQLPPAEQLETALAGPTLSLVSMKEAAAGSPLKLLLRTATIKMRVHIPVRQVHTPFTKQEFTM